MNPLSTRISILHIFNLPVPWAGAGMPHLSFECPAVQTKAAKSGQPWLEYLAEQIPTALLLEKYV
jgi:hypothetical protein